MNRAILIPLFNHSAHTGLGLRDIHSLVVSVYFDVEGRTGYRYTGKSEPLSNRPQDTSC